MSDNLGFVRVKASTIHVDVCNVRHNLDAIKKEISQAVSEKVHVLVFNEMTLTGYTLGDLVFNQTILKNVLDAIEELKEFSKGKNIFFTVGAPLNVDNSLYNCAINFFNGEILGVTPKTFIPNYREFYEGRYFAKALSENIYIDLAGSKVPFGSKIIYQNSLMEDMKVAVELCEDLWASSTPSTKQAEAGATLILNLSASNEVVAKAEYRRDLVRMTSARLLCVYAYADAGDGESTSDLVFSGHNIIAENGRILEENAPFDKNETIADVDLEIIEIERNKNNVFVNNKEGFIYVDFALKVDKPDKLYRKVPENPFVDEDGDITSRVDFILKIQAHGLMKRLLSCHSKNLVVGLSGGLDSTLALLVSCDAFDLLGYDRKGIEAITLPAFGTSSRTKNNATALAKALGVSFREINIGESIKQHFIDIGHDINVHNSTYENAQARERTQVLLDIANENNALMVGTGDLSELCLGWTTYNGDHMSSYGVNSSIPKTLVIYLCKGYGLMHPEVKEVLDDIIDTPVSPELLPTKEGEISQKTEDIIGPYRFHDFVIFHYLRYGFRPQKIYYLASIAFENEYTSDEMKEWLKLFFKRFFTNQFKRNCLPDGPKVGSVAISPRGDLRMPSDGSYALYIEEIEKL